MARERRNYSGADEMVILREHLIEKVPISEVCEKHGLQPTVFYGWQKKLFEEGAAVFEQPRARSSRRRAAEQRKIEALEAKVREKNEVLAELLGEHVALKKSWGDLKAQWVAHVFRRGGATSRRVSVVIMRTGAPARLTK